MKSIEELVSLSGKVEFECRIFPLVSQSRRLVKEGELSQLLELPGKISERQIYLHLFNDYLLLSHPKEYLIQESNNSIRQMKSIEELVSLSGKVEFECRIFPLVSQSRRLVKEGELSQLLELPGKISERQIYLHLFNDYLLLSHPKEGSRFTVFDHTSVSRVRVENCQIKLYSLQKNLFRLHLLENSEGATTSFMLRSQTQSEKLRWLSALSPTPKIDFSACQDLPQMLCLRSYVPHQPDELNLEKADVTVVHQQTSDGWVEGTRLADSERGWFPNSHVELISSQRARLRNLWERQRIACATCKQPQSTA
ncbi:UNVERIFIED_CONTAM: hypothetical protein FKN15_070644 [Acipenser sinensis]